MRPINVVPLLIALACLGAVPLPARAQDPTPDRVQLELQRTDEVIQRAEALLAVNANVQASAEIDIARQRQTDARAAYGAARFRLALDLTLGARVHADRAIALLRGLDLPRIRDQIDRTREFIDRARERLEDCRNPRARSQLEVAETMLKRAVEALDSGRPLAALQLTRGSRDHARRALQLCRMEDQVADAVERALQRTDDVLMRAHDIVDDRAVDPARRALGRADELQEAAYRQLRAEHVEPALRLTRAARELAQRALRLAGAAR